MASHASTVPSNWAWSHRSSHLLLTLTLVFSLLLSPVRAQYFIINQPTESTVWANGSPFPISWTKGLLDGVTIFDVELTRLNEDGLFYVVQNVPTTLNTLNILLEDVPEGDDYFLLSLSSVHSYVYAISGRFTVTNSTQTNPSPDPSAPTVTVSGVPNPLKQFAATLGPAVANGGVSLLFGDSPNTRALGVGGLVALCAAFLGGAMTLC